MTNTTAVRPSLDGLHRLIAALQCRGLHHQKVIAMVADLPLGGIGAVAGRPPFVAQGTEIVPPVLGKGRLLEVAGQVEVLRKPGYELDTFRRQAFQRCGGDESAVGDEDDILESLIIEELLHLQGGIRVPPLVRGIARQDLAHDGQPVLLYSGADHELLEIGPLILAVAVADVEVAVGGAIICSLHRGRWYRNGW
jgi:hypothetical protein